MTELTPAPLLLCAEAVAQRGDVVVLLRRLTICLVLVELVVVGVITVGAVALLLWLHWPERTGAFSSGDGRRSDDDPAPDASVADVGRAERPSGWQTRERGLLGSREPGGGSDGGPVAPE